MSSLNQIVAVPENLKRRGMHGKQELNWLLILLFCAPTVTTEFMLVLI